MWVSLHLRLLALVGLLATVSSGPLRKARKHERREQISASHQKVQDLAAFAVEEFKSHSFRTREYQHGVKFEVLRAERTLAIHPDNPKHNARNYFLTLRVFMDQECAVHRTQLVFYPNTGTKMIVSREVDTNSPDCAGASFLAAGDSRNPAKRFVSPHMKELAGER
jgi:hypothetical protein